MPAYRPRWLRGDLIAGLAVWAVLVPEGMAYADLAGVPPEAGLYAAMSAGLLFAVFATSRRLSVGPSSAIAILSFSTVAGVAGSTGDVVALSAALAIMTGAFLVVGGLARLGFISELLGRPVIRGFTIGAAAIIVVGQLPKLFGVETEGDNFFEDLASLVGHLDETDLLTLGVGAASLALIFGLEVVVPKLPAALVALVAFIAISAALDLEAEGVEVVGDIPAGLPSIGVPDVSGSDLAALVPGALALALVAFAETIAIARSVEGRHKDERVDPNREMIALGVANAGAGFAQSFAVDGSLSRTTVNEGGGARTQLAGVATAVLIIVTAVALTPLFGPLPEATLGAIVIAAVWHLLAPVPLLRLWRIDRREVAVALSCLLGILVFGILEGILIAVALSLLLILYRASRPRSAELGRVPGEDTFRALGEKRPGEETYPGLVIFRYDADLFFANANDFEGKIRRLVREADEALAAVIVDAEAIGDIDTTALEMMRELDEELAEDDIDLVFARLRTPLIDKLRRFGVAKETFDRIFITVTSAVDAYADRGARTASRPRWPR